MKTEEPGIVEFERRLRAGPEAVFPFFTDSGKMLRWMGVTAELDPRPGGLFRVNVTGGEVARGEYVVVTVPTRVVFTWGWERPGADPAPGGSTVEVLLTSDGDRTALRVRHLGLACDQRAGQSEGWNHYLDRLATAVTGGDPGPDPWVEKDPG